MLEQSSLLLRPWNMPSGGEPGARVRQLAGSDGETEGFVRIAEQPVLRWLSRQTLQIFEPPDNSLVFALRRGWGWPGAWQVVDADERLVGTLRGRSLRDGFGQFLAAMETVGKNGRARFLTLDGRELGAYTTGQDGTLLAFTPALEGNPFAKMMLLGAVLITEM